MKGKFVPIVAVAPGMRDKLKRDGEIGRESDKGKEKLNCVDYWQNFNPSCLRQFVQLSSHNAASIIPMIEDPRKNMASLFSGRNELITAPIHIYVPYLAVNITICDTRRFI